MSTRAGSLVGRIYQQEIKLAEAVRETGLAFPQGATLLFRNSGKGILTTEAFRYRLKTHHCEVPPGLSHPAP